MAVSFLETSTIADLIEGSHFKLITAKDADSVKTVLRILEKNKIHSVPIQDHHGKLIGTVDMVSNFLL